MQCPVCGRDVENLLDGSCAQCASERLPFVTLPPVLDAVVCAHCGRLQSGSSWRPLAKDQNLRVEQIIRDYLQLDPLVRAPEWAFADTWEDHRNVTVQVTMKGSLEKIPVERTVGTRIRMKNGACPDCSREMGGYFEAIVQVRGSPGTDLERLLPKIEHELIERLDTYKEEGRPNSFIGKVEKMKHGTDYYFGSKEASRQLAQEIAELYGADTEESMKLVGRKDGRDLTRTTHLVRLPPYARGDFLLVDGVLCKLLAFDRRHLQVLDLVRHVKVRRDLSRLEFKVVGRAYEQANAVIVSRGAAHVQVLDPVSFKTVDVPQTDVPKDAGETVPVFRYEEILYVVAALEN
jgi:nonsense-mediated mRNA decay protein 3